MKIKIDERIICIPPYISTTWDQVIFLQSEEDPETHLFTLEIHLNEGKVVQIPHLDSSLIDISFSAHIRYLETSMSSSPQRNENESTKTLGGFLQQLTGLSPEQLAHMPIRFSVAGIEGMPGAEMLQHNLSEKNAPDMPSEVLEKISGMIKMMINGDVGVFPKPEPHCNCPHCQVARSMHGISKNQEDHDIETPVTDEEISFRNWDISKQGDQLYNVTNPLDSKEHYSVYLGSPVGCTCGEPHCEHIKAVLYS